jgi:translation initiation factor 2 alpha subunit (eIF-2alpha)
VLFFLAGCSISHSLNTKRFEVIDEYKTELNVKEPVAVVNASLNKEKIVMCKLLMHKHYGSLYDFTNSACESVKDLLDQQDIKIDENSDKKLQLSIERAYCRHGIPDRGLTELKVKTGDGLEKIYKARYTNHGGGYFWTLTFERAMAMCVKQMFHDQDIINYLEN